MLHELERIVENRINSGDKPVQSARARKFYGDAQVFKLSVNRARAYVIRPDDYLWAHAFDGQDRQGGDKVETRSRVHV